MPSPVANAANLSVNYSLSCPPPQIGEPTFTPLSPREPNKRRPGGAHAATAASLGSQSARRAPRGKGEPEEEAAPGPPFKSDKERRAFLLQEKRRWVVEARLATMQLLAVAQGHDPPNVRQIVDIDLRDLPELPDRMRMWSARRREELRYSNQVGAPPEPALLLDREPLSKHSVQQLRQSTIDWQCLSEAARAGPGGAKAQS